MRRAPNQSWQPTPGSRRSGFPVASGPARLHSALVCRTDMSKTPVRALQTEHTGCFSVPSVRGMRVECVLHLLRDGSAERVCSVTIKPFRDEAAPSRRAGQHVENRLSLLIAKETIGNQTIKYSVDVTGGITVESWHSEKYYDEVKVSHSWYLITGDLTQELPEQEPQIIYIAGGMFLREISLRHRPGPSASGSIRRLTPLQFATLNKGSFILTTGRWYIADFLTDEN